VGALCDGQHRRDGEERSALAWPSPARSAFLQAVRVRVRVRDGVGGRVRARVRARVRVRAALLQEHVLLTDVDAARVARLQVHALDDVLPLVGVQRLEHGER